MRDCIYVPTTWGINLARAMTNDNVAGIPAPQPRLLATAGQMRQMRSSSIAIPCPTPMHMAQSA
ncbi:hypothetical protein GCM10011348_21980 [Marinobacterium nitratireducens]|uniref:Uncharacterized protein n=1 Tax=Marinobacterium nitratireducens TaxID=518897 RepID=A0A917ZFN4_9GAMM|nr:hypothetical protein GCM10011348_21980 [Marinobacterium nitratireducens]